MLSYTALLVILFTQIFVASIECFPSDSIYLAAGNDRPSINTLRVQSTMAPQQMIGTSNNLPQSEIDALHDLYSSTNGDNWNWNVPNPVLPGNHWNFTPNCNPCAEQWQGIACNYTEYNGTLSTRLHVVKLYLTSTNLVGTLPTSLCNLSEISELDLSSNKINGSLWESVGNCSKLELMSLSTNRITGTIPQSICHAKLLSQLSLGSNALSGTLPTCIGNLHLLTILDLSSNGLAHSIPESIGSLIALQQLLLDYNGFNGSIPSSIGRLKALSVIYLHYNSLSGVIPENIGGLSNLAKLYLHHNKLSGMIPASLGSLSNLTYLYLQNNVLTGRIPHNLCNMSSIAYLSLQSNKLNGTIPNCITHLQSLQQLRLYLNILTGTIPPEIGLLPRLSVLAMYNNRLTGPLPSLWLSDSPMDFLDLNENLLTGTLPDSMGSLQYLQSLYIDVNHLEGTIPVSWANLTALQTFYLPYNRLSGTIPAQFGNLPVLNIFELNGNRLTGTIPETFGTNDNLLELHLDTNFLHGSIPKAIFGIRGLEILSLFSNRLTGTISDAIGNVSEARYILLADNILSGSLPSSIGELSYLQELELYDNKLTGTLPPSLRNLHKLASLLVNNNAFSGSIDNIFDDVHQSVLTTVQISHNSLTGSLPSALFQLPKLLTFAAVRNCFHGTLPEIICNNTNLQILAISGLQSADSCQKILLKGISSAYIVRDSIKRGIPICLFQMPRLATLHLSGNGLTGTLPSTVNVSNALLDLSLSHNSLSGTIPIVFQEKSWLNLDLAYNKFGGVMNNKIDPRKSNKTSGKVAISLDNNRLSGTVPHSLVDIHNISILQGNVLACRYDQSDLPPHDPQTGNYECGSSSFDIPYYIWLGIILLSSTLLMISWWFRVEINSALNVVDVIVVLNQWQSTFANPFVERYQLLNFAHVRDVYRLVAKLSLAMAVSIVVLLLPVYVYFNITVGTHEYAYAWTVSAAFISGSTPAIVELVLLLLLVSSLIIAFRLFWRQLLFTETSLRNDLQQSIDKYSDTTTKNMRATAFQLVTVYSVVLLFNFAVVLGVNIAYVYINLYGSIHLLPFAQVALSFFKMIWNKFCASWFIPLIAARLAPAVVEDMVIHDVKHFSLQLFMALFNNIAIPCLVVAVISPNCFAYLFSEAPSVEASYAVETCFGFDETTNQCDNFVIVTQSTSYNPPFVYSFQCSSSFITYYAPAFVALCILSAFGTPCVQLLQYYYVNYRVNNSKGTSDEESNKPNAVVDFLWSLTPLILRPLESRDPTTTAMTTRESQFIFGVEIKFDIFQLYCESNQQLLKLLTFLGILMTFGAVFPPLAVTVFVTIVVIAVFTKLKIARFLHNAESSGRIEYLKLIDKECQGVGSTRIVQRSVLMVVTFSCWFYALFLFDTMGDAVGIQRSVWIFPVMMTAPIVIHLIDIIIKARSSDRIFGLRVSKLISIEMIDFIALSPLHRRKQVDTVSVANENDRIPL